MRRKEQEAFDIFDEAIRRHVHADSKELAGVVTLFSGGNDSTVLTHLFRKRCTHVGHVNTGIGIEGTRQYVRDTCRDWGLDLIEESPPPGSTYRELVLDQGFPGPGQHGKMYQRLKERALRQIRRKFVINPRKERVVFLAGRRRTESQRRSSRNIPEHERQGSIVWVSPIVNWTSRDMIEYREQHNLPRNEVSELLHMSGECLCGAFARVGEREEIKLWFPETDQQISALEREVTVAGHCWPKNIWGWGAPHVSEMLNPSQLTLPLCSSCPNRHEVGLP